jgi:hypothetical protein
LASLSSQKKSFSSTSFASTQSAAKKRLQREQALEKQAQIVGSQRMENLQLISAMIVVQWLQYHSNAE